MRADPFSLRAIRDHSALVLAPIEARVETYGVKTKLCRSSLKRVCREVRWIFNQSVVIGPELTLLVGASRSYRGVHRMLMEAQREIHVHQAHLVAVFFHYPAE